MNLLLVDQTEVSERGLVTVTGRRAEHLVRTLHVEAGSVVMAGVVDGGIGRAEVLSVTPAGVTLRLDLGAPPPRPTTIVILAMVRPQIMKRTLQHLATLGVRHIALIGARRVEKSYFSQRLFDGDGYREHLLLGLEQARDTWLPTLSIHRRFRPFIEDVAPTLLSDIIHRIVAHPGPGASPVRPLGPERPVALAIGPEGGWTDYEVRSFAALGFLRVTLGPRILRVETAIPVLYGALGLTPPPSKAPATSSPPDSSRQGNP